MPLDPQSEAILAALNATGLLPISQFSPVEAREKALAMRAAAPPAHEMWKVTEERGSDTERRLHRQNPDAPRARSG